MSKRTIRAACVTFAACMCMAGSASAQTSQPLEGAGGIAISTSSTTTTTIVGGVILTVVLASKKANIETYLRDNAVALRHEISQGGGETVADLGHVFSVSPELHARFAQVMRQSRDVLLPLLDVDTLDAARAQLFVEIVAQRGLRAGIFQEPG